MDQASTTTLEQTAPSFYEDRGKRRGIAAWLTTTDHKRIGLMYLGCILVFFSVAVLIVNGDTPKPVNSLCDVRDA